MAHGRQAHLRCWALITTVHPQHFVIFPDWNCPHLPQAPATTIHSLSVPMKLTALGTSCKWSHTVLAISWPADFTSYNVPKVHPLCSKCQNFPPFSGCIIFRGACIRTTFYSSVHPSRATRVAPTFCLLRLRLLWTRVCKYLSPWFPSFGVPAQRWNPKYGDSLSCLGRLSCYVLQQRHDFAFPPITHGVPSRHPRRHLFAVFKSNSHPDGCNQLRF